MVSGYLVTKAIAGGDHADGRADDRAGSCRRAGRRRRRAADGCGLPSWPHRRCCWSISSSRRASTTCSPRSTSTRGWSRAPTCCRLRCGLCGVVPRGLADAARPEDRGDSAPSSARRTAGYTAFLFAQCEGRDLWQTPLLLPMLLARPSIAGASAYAILDVFMDIPRNEPLVGASRWRRSRCVPPGSSSRSHGSRHVELAIARHDQGAKQASSVPAVCCARPRVILRLPPTTRLDTRRIAACRRRSLSSACSVRNRLRPRWPIRPLMPEVARCSAHNGLENATMTDLQQVPAAREWHDWTELDAKAWPEKVRSNYTLVPTTCFNCEAACGLLAYFDKETGEIRRSRATPSTRRSRGRNCAKGPATINQIYDTSGSCSPLSRRVDRGTGVGAHQLGQALTRSVADPHGFRGGPPQRGDVPRRPSGRRRLRRPCAEGVGRRRAQQPHQHLLVERSHRLPELDGPRPPSRGFRQRRGDLSHLVAPRSRPLLQPARTADHGGTGQWRHSDLLSTRVCRTPVQRPTHWLPTWPGTEPFLCLAIATCCSRTGLER